MVINKHVKPDYDYPEKGWYIKQELGFLMRAACCVWGVWGHLCGRQQNLPRRKYGEGPFSKGTADSTEAVCGYDFCHIPSWHFSVSTKTYIVWLHVVNCRCAREEEKFISNLPVETLHAA